MATHLVVGTPKHMHGLRTFSAHVLVSIFHSFPFLDLLQTIPKEPTKIRHFLFANQQWWTKTCPTLTDELAGPSRTTVARTFIIN